MELHTVLVTRFHKYMKYIGQYICKFFWPMLFSVGLFSVSIPPIDIWWHLQIGRDILVHRLWPSPDIYSYTTDRSWVVHSWLADCLFFLYWSIVEWIKPNRGDVGLEILRRFILISTSLMAYYRVKKRTGNDYLSLLTIIFFACLLWNREIRPFLFNPIFFLFTNILFLKNKPNCSDWFVFPLLFMLWANVHGAFIIPIIVYVFTLCINIILYYVRGLTHHKASWHFLFFICSLVTFINPHPVGLLSRIIRANEYPSEDWLSLYAGFIAYPWVNLLLFAVFIIILSFWIFSIFKSGNLCNHLGNASYLSEILYILLAIAHIRLTWLIIFPWIEACVRFDKYRGNLKKRECNYNLLLSIFLLGFFLQIPIPFEGVFQMPKETMDYFTMNNLHGNVFTPWPWGGYITWRTDKRAQNFVDTRIEPFTLREIEIASTFPIMPIRLLGEMVIRYKTEYIIINTHDLKPEWDFLTSQEFISPIYQYNKIFIYHINTPNVLNFYRDKQWIHDFKFSDKPF